MFEESKEFVKNAVMPSAEELKRIAHKDKRFQAAKYRFKRRAYPGILGKDEYDHEQYDFENAGCS